MALGHYTRLGEALALITTTFGKLLACSLLALAAPFAWAAAPDVAAAAPATAITSHAVGPAGPAVGPAAPGTTSAASAAVSTSQQAAAGRPDGLYAEIVTSLGTIVIELAFQRVPMTVAGFVGLAEGTIENTAFPPGRPFYDGTTFHRVVPGHVIQAGIPASEARGPGYRYPNEIDRAMSHDHAGAVGIANSGPHTNGSQFYITLGDRSYLDGNYTLFGEVVEGMDVVRAIEAGGGSDPVEIGRLRIVRVGAAAEAFRPDTASFRGLVAAAEVRVAEERRRRHEREERWIRQGWPEAERLDSGVRTLLLEDGTGPLSEPGDEVRLAYTGQTMSGLRFASRDDGTPGPGDDGVGFTYRIGESSIVPGLDEMVPRMRVGERRVVVVPDDLGYGSSGYYAPEVPGQPRFVIAPETLLVYELRRLPFEEA